MSGKINWWTVDNEVENLMINGSLKHTLKQVKKVNKRTRVLNVELKKFSALTSYKRYVDIKTDVLRNVSNDEETDDEIFADNDNVAPDDDDENNEIDESDQNNASENENKNTENDNEKNEENQKKDFVENDENKEEEINDDKYEENENCEEEKYEEDEYYEDEKYKDDDYYEDEKYEKNENYEDEKYEKNENYEDDKYYENEKYEENENYEDDEEYEEGEYYGNEKYEEDEYYENEKYEKDENNEENDKYEEDENNEENDKYEETEKYDEKSEIIDETDDDTENNDKTLDSPKPIDETQKKPQPIITCTEILKSKYTIIRSKDENDKSVIQEEEEEDEHNLEKPDDVNEVINVEKTSPETYRVSQLKRINLLYDSNDSDDSDSSIDESKKILPELKRRKNIKERIAATSQVISDPSDSDEWYTKNAPGKKTLSNNENITKHHSASSLYISDSDNDDIVNSTENKIVTPKTKKVIKKSLKSQINDQEYNYSNNERLINNNNNNNSINNTEPTEAESLQYVLKNILSQNNTQDILNSEINTSTPVQDEIFPRPVELNEYIEREGLIHTEELSTIDIDEIRKSNDDEDIWLMEIPKCIISDRQLCGKKIILEKKKMKIDDVCYETISRKDKLVSCILSAERDKPEYKAVNVSLVRSIVVRQESSERSCVPLGETSTLPKTKITDLVPFPSHIKPRNPLMILNDEEKRKKLDSSTKDDNFIEEKKDKKIDNVSKEFSDNEIQERSKKIHSPSKISDTPKIPPQTIRRSTGTKRKKKTPIWRRNNFLLPTKKNKNVKKKL